MIIKHQNVYFTAAYIQYVAQRTVWLSLTVVHMTFLKVDILDKSEVLRNKTPVERWTDAALE